MRCGVGVVALHGVIDSFRHEAEFHYMLGGQWMTHFEFAVRTYPVQIVGDNPLTQGLSDFEVTTEQYYLLVDPANTMLATMSVAWTKHYGQGRVFDCSLGDSVETVSHPIVQELVKRGLVWASRVR